MTQLTAQETRDKTATAQTARVAKHHHPLLKRLRSISPQRELTSSEVLAVTERQVTTLLAAFWANGSGPVASRELIESLPWVSVEYPADLTGDGMSQQQPDGGWIIAINPDRPRCRQLFSLAHELKHVIDGDIADRFYEEGRGFSAHERSEKACDYFASCLLMPKRQLTRDWCTGTQSIDKLARRYGVSRQAMQYRLSQLGLLDQVPRCGFQLSPNDIERASGAGSTAWLASRLRLPVATPMTPLGQGAI